MLKYDLICLGNLTIDDVILPDQSRKLGCFGGDTIYSALGAACWTEHVGFVAPLGIDFPAEHVELLRRSGWDLRGLPQRPLPSIRNWVIYQDDNSRRWVLESNADDFLELSPKLQDIPKDYLQSSAFTLLAMDLAAQEALASQLSRLGLVGIDPQEDYIRGNEERILAMLQFAHVFLPSHEEVFRLLGHRDYPRACRELAAYNVKIVVIKMGSEGSLIYDQVNDHFWEIPAVKTQVIDATGAGDAYCGGFMAMYVKSADLLLAGLAGAVSASYAIEGFGLQHMFTIDKRQAHSRLENLKAKVK